MYSKEEYESLEAKNTKLEARVAGLESALLDIRTAGYNTDPTCVWMQRVAASALSSFPHPGPQQDFIGQNPKPGLREHDGWAWHPTTISGPLVIKRLSGQDMVFILVTDAKTGKECKLNHLYADVFETRSQTPGFKQELLRSITNALNMKHVSKVRAVLATTRYSVIYDSATDAPPSEGSI